MFHYNNDLKSHTIGKTEISFDSMEAFQTWKEREEESTYSMYAKDQRSYKPKAMEGYVHGTYIRAAMCEVVDNVFTGVVNRYYYVCCRDGKYVENRKPRITSGK